MLAIDPVFESEGLRERDLIKWLAIVCMAAAVISGAVLGLWEQIHPFFGHARYQVVASPIQRWSYALPQVFKSIGFVILPRGVSSLMC